MAKMIIADNKHPGDNITGKTATDETQDSSTPIRLTAFSHGAGCGCKISPAVLDAILPKDQKTALKDARLLVGNHQRDDAAVWQIDESQSLIATTDFFMPIVDDPFDFGRVAAANAISDVYAMGGRPVLALAILGWPVKLLPIELAGKVLDGAREVCREAGITLAGGHSIDTPEPIFGLAVNGLIQTRHLKMNQTAEPDCRLYLTKPLGVGILSTAQKKGLVRPQDSAAALRNMTSLNKIGALLGEMEAVRAMTDVTGFGLLGHLKEVCQASNINAVIEFENVPVLDNLDFYLEQGAVPGGTKRNWDSYGRFIGNITERQKQILADPQTSGGLLVVVRNKREDIALFEELLSREGINIWPVGRTVFRSQAVSVNPDIKLDQENAGVPTAFNQPYIRIE
nr:selenide, water dikinase SelD [Arachidicoccus rhizosphaerae]